MASNDFCLREAYNHSEYFQINDWQGYNWRISRMVLLNLPYYFGDHENGEHLAVLSPHGVSLL